MWKRTIEEAFPKTVVDGADVMFCSGRVFHDPGELSGDRKSSVADGLKTGASDDKR